MVTTGRHRRPQTLLAAYCETLGYLRMRRTKELALNSARIEAELANRAKSEFLANMSHELRTPLNAIIGFSELIQHLGEADTSRSLDYAANISAASRHLLHVISDILDISKIESGTASLTLSRQDVHELIDSSVVLMRERLENKNQRLEVRLAPELPALVADGRRIKQILINLLSNAHKFTPAGGRIEIEVLGRENSDITIAVADSGPGMTAEEIQVALKPFGQIRAHHLHSHEGTGLGLPIAMALAKQHRGELRVISAIGQGTKVVLILPTRWPEAVAESTATPRVPLPGLSSNEQTGRLTGELRATG